MSNRADQSSSSASNSRIDPIFFNLNNQPPKKKEEEVEENPPWLNPPPPYSSVIDNNQDSASAAPSAPPLELMDGSEQQPLPDDNHQQPQSPQHIPHNNNTSYGSISHPQQTSINAKSNSAFKKIRSWLLKENDHNGLTKQRQNSRFFQIFVALLFFLLFFVSIVQYFTPSEEANCYEGVLWEQLPKQFDYTNKGLRIRMVGGFINSGRITIKKQKDKANTVEMYAKISPPSLINDPEFGFGFTRLFNGSTTLELFIPEAKTRKHCIFFNAVIYLPNEGTLNFFEGSTPNTLYIINEDITLDINIFHILTSNKRIDLHSSWKGEQLDLTTQNAPIDIAKPIYEGVLVQIETNGAPIRIRDVLNASYAITMTTKNDDIITDKMISSSTIVSTSSNGYLSHNEIRADRAELKTTNGLVELHHGHVSQVLNIQTLNAKLTLNMETCENCTVLATTSNADSVINMPENYQGDFVAKTSASDSILLTDSTDWTHLRHIEDYEITGTRYSPDNTEHSGGHLVTQTNGGNIHLHFGDKTRA